MMEYPEKWICAFLIGTTVKEICKEAGISKTKFYALRKDKRFQEVLRERRDALVLSGVQALRAHFFKAVEVLAEIAENADTAAQTRVYAASTILTQLKDWVTTEDLIRRVEALEKSENNDSVTVLGVAL